MEQEQDVTSRQGFSAIGQPGYYQSVPQDEEVMFIGRKVASKTPKMRKGAISLQNKPN